MYWRKAPYQHIFSDEHAVSQSATRRHLRDVGIAKKALNLSCIVPATQKRCKVLLGLNHDGAHFFFIGSVSKLGKSDKLRWAFLKPKMGWWQF